MRLTLWVLARAASIDDHFHGLQHDLQIQQKRPVLNVVEIVTEFFFSILDRRSILVADLCPTTEAGPHRVPVIIEWYGRYQLGDYFRSLRPGSDQAHLPLEH